MSVDPFIQAPLNSQSMNPYSYIMNNPMAGIDPTGYVARGTNASNWRTSSCDLDPMGCTGTPVEKILDQYVGNGQENGMHKSFTENLAKFNERMQNEMAAIDKAWGVVADAMGSVTVTDLSNVVQDANKIGSSGFFSLPDAKRKELLTEIDKAILKNDLNKVFSGEGAEDAAAFAWANAMNPISTKYNVELGARIFEDRTNRGSYQIGNTITDFNNIGINDMTRSRMDKMMSFRSSPAIIHTHALGKPDGSSEFFSADNVRKVRSQARGDLATAAANFSNAYLATPNGYLKKFTFSEWKYQQGAPASSAVTTLGKIKN